MVMTSGSVLGHMGGWVGREVGKVATENLLAESVTYICLRKEALPVRSVFPPHSRAVVSTRTFSFKARW